MKYRSRSGRGFTLMELLVVLVLVGLMLGLAAANFSRGTGGAELRGQARELVSLLRLTRSRAITESRVLSLAVDPETNGYQVLPGGAARPLDEELSLRIAAGPMRGNRARDAIHFYPDGSSSGGELKLQSPAGERRIRVDWLSGEVAPGG